jgi:hypothetical protein
MSFDLIASVPRPVTLDEVNAAFAEIGAPLRSEDDPTTAAGYFWVRYRDTGIEAYDGEFAGGFELYVEREATSVDYRLGCSSGDDIAVAWLFALAVALAAGGRVSDPQAGREYHGKSLDKLRSKAATLRRQIAKQWEQLTPEQRAFRTRREGESDRAYRERLFLKDAGERERRTYLRDALTTALAAGDEAEIARLLGLLPAKPAFLEDGLDPCFRASRPDAAARYAARFPLDAVRAHFVASAGFSGLFAAPYVAFLRAALAPMLGEEALAEARARAADAEVRAALAP